MFRCNYGGCVARTAVCDGVYQCADGSDEIQSVCRQVNCIVPYPTNNTVYFVSGKTNHWTEIPYVNFFPYLPTHVNSKNITKYIQACEYFRMQRMPKWFTN